MNLSSLIIEYLANFSLNILKLLLFRNELGIFYISFMFIICIFASALVIVLSKNDCRYPVPSQPVTKHSLIPLGHKKSAREVEVAKFLKKVFFPLFPTEL